MSVTVGLDIGGTKIAAAVVDEHGRLLDSARADTPVAAEAIIDSAADLVRGFTGRHDVAAVGAACAAFVDRERSTVRFAPNIAWREAPVRSMLQERVHLPVVIENDANAAAWGEFLYGPARDLEHMVLITVGTGIGGGIVLDGQLMRGAFGIAGEIGHLRVVPGGLRCGCGNRGCWEPYASGNALVREARELLRTGSTVASTLADRCGGDPDALRGPDITAAAAAGDQVSIDLLTGLGEWIGVGAASLVSILDPEMIVLGGGVAAAGDLLLDPAVGAFTRNLPGRGHRPEATWSLAGLGNDAGVIGAAALARDARR